MGDLTLNSTILVVDADKRMNSQLYEIFSAESYKVICAYTGDEAIRILGENPDIPLMILDVVVPDLDGWLLLSFVKEQYRTKVVVLTSLSDEYSEVKGLRAGADDYVTKPFRRAVLVERLNRLSDSYYGENTCDLICDTIRISQQEMRVFVAEQELPVTTKEYQLLRLLMKNSPNVLSREAILEKIWGFEYVGNDRTIDTHIKMLRHSLGAQGKRIRTVRGVGYSFDGVVEKYRS